MPIQNREIADIFDHVADLLEIGGANRFRVRAYRNAANTVRDQSRPLAAMVEKHEDLSDLPDIGEDLAGKIAEIVRTGRLPLLKEISGEVPEAIVAATRIPGIGPKRATALFRELDLHSLDDLRKAAEDGTIARIEGFGPKTQARIREELSRDDFGRHRFRLDAAQDYAEPLLDWIRKIDGVTKAEIAGSYRRRKETVGDLDILVAGYDYLAITDHSKSQRVAGGLDEHEIEAQIEEIDALNEGFDGFRLLKSCEVDILEDGSLDFPDTLLGKLDLVVASVHSNFNLSADRQTERIIRAMDNAFVSILGHPSGRLIGSRRPYEIDIERPVEAAKDRCCCLELNANPQRLDLNDVNCRLARDQGVKIAISTDAHSKGGLGNMRFGVDQARRGWLGAADVLNTRSWRDVATILQRG